ncbi:hypothetical protein PM8797T_25066 [Gimesia maris DSM 8797]|nr:hypothetical protein PM8797T_25066 [Gimesia maris DSM 8797]
MQVPARKHDLKQVHQEIRHRYRRTIHIDWLLSCFFPLLSAKTTR